MSSFERIPVALRALAAHFIAAPLTLGTSWAGAVNAPFGLAIIEGALAALASRGLGLPAWWVAIQFAFAPLIMVALGLGLDPRWYLVAFALLALVFGAIAASRVPLFLSGNAALVRLVARVPDRRGLSFFDAGCGVGSALCAVSRARPDVRCEGVETAPLPWLLALMRGSLARPGFRVRYASLWRAHLGRPDIVYAYLSPAAMPRFWVKARREMKPGALLISNSFPAPEVNPDEILPWGAAPDQALFVYRM